MHRAAESVQVESEMTDADLVAHISGFLTAARFQAIDSRISDPRRPTRRLEDRAARLAARGDLIEVRSGSTPSQPAAEFAVGRLNMHRDGYGFLISDRPLEGIAGDVFIPRESAKTAMHGDRVVVRIARIEADGRADGEIVKVLKRAHATVVGEIPASGAAASMSCLRTTASSSGSRSPRGWSSRPPAR